MKPQDHPYIDRRLQPAWATRQATHSRVGQPLFWFAVCLFLLTGLAAARPVISPPVNQASFVQPDSPAYGIAPGSMFAIFGQDMGPAALTSAPVFPLPTELSETSVQISLGSATLKCFMVFTSGGQIAAILPSSAVPGEWRITVTYRGETSAPQPIRVVENAVGIFTIRQNGIGPAVVSDADFAVNSAVNAFAPGHTAILWATGLGARRIDNLAGPEDLKDAFNVEVGVGGVSAKVLYAGPSGCCAGVDQVIFEIPSLPEDIREGCHVPVVVKAGGHFSNYASMSVAANGRICGDDHILPSRDVARLHEQRLLRVASAVATEGATSIGPLLPSGFAGLSDESAQIDERVSRLRLAGVQFEPGNFPLPGFLSRRSCLVWTGSPESPSGIHANPVGRVEAFSEGTRIGEIRLALAAQQTVSLPMRPDRLRFDLLAGGAGAGIESTDKTRLGTAPAEILAAVDAGVLSGDWGLLARLTKATPDEDLALWLQVFSEHDGVLRIASLLCESNAPGPFALGVLNALAGTPLLTDARLSSGSARSNQSVDSASGVDSVYVDIQDDHGRSYWVDPSVSWEATSESDQGPFRFTVVCSAGLNSLGLSIACRHNAPAPQSFEIDFEESGVQIFRGELTAGQDSFTAGQTIRGWPIGQPTPRRLPGLGSAGVLTVRVLGSTGTLARSRFVVWQ